jgi:metal-sulfur cluster biosynthetic enzyme
VLTSDLIKTIQDPEKPNSLEDLGVVSEDGVSVDRLAPNSEELVISVKLVPTVPHCSLATLIGLCVRVRLERELQSRHKLDIFIAEGTHETADESE